MYAAAAARTITITARGMAIAVAVIDVDQFKRLNDGYGHGIGTRPAPGRPTPTRDDQTADIAARTGGDEFVIIAYLETEAGVASFVERCRHLLLNHTKGVAVSTSVGIAWEILASSRFELDTLLTRADFAMYEAKRRGGGLLVQQ